MCRSLGCPGSGKNKFVVIMPLHVCIPPVHCNLSSVLGMAGHSLAGCRNALLYSVGVLKSNERVSAQSCRIGITVCQT